MSYVLQLPFMTLVWYRFNWIIEFKKNQSYQFNLFTLFGRLVTLNNLNENNSTPSSRRIGKKNVLLQFK